MKHVRRFSFYFVYFAVTTERNVSRQAFRNVLRLCKPPPTTGSILTWTEVRSRFRLWPFWRALFWWWIDLKHYCKWNLCLSAFILYISSVHVSPQDFALLRRISTNAPRIKNSCRVLFHDVGDSSFPSLRLSRFKSKFISAVTILNFQSLYSISKHDGR